MASSSDWTPGAPLVALLTLQGRFLIAEPYFATGRDVPRRMTIDRGSKAEPGQLALVTQGAKGRAKVLRMLGSPDVARDVVEALMAERGLARRFPPGVEKAGADAAAAIAQDDPAGTGRRDLRDLPTFTIDPATAKDFDDAISAEAIDPAHPERVRIWVHIADVSAYVRPGSPVDREAFRRGTSVYVPGAVEPMLPEVLSNGACSLVPGEDRLAVTVELQYDGADVVKAGFCRSTIRSDARLSYEDVDRVFAGDEPAQDPWAAPLALARGVAARLQERRDGRGNALAIDTVEPEFRFDAKGHVADVGRSAPTESHRLIEHLMIAANEQVATLLVGKGAPALYRVHEKPEPGGAEKLVAQLASLGVPTPVVGEHVAKSEAAKVVAACSRKVDSWVRQTGHGRAALTSLVLRALKPARYDPKPLGHAGLGLEHYCHFTSPIRRYPDLICHRALLSLIGAGEEAPRAAVLEDSGVLLSAREREAMVIERDADDIVRCFVLERELKERGWDTPFEGEVTGLISAGAFVAFGDIGADGMVPVRQLRGDWYELNEEGTILRGERTGTTIRLGEAMRVLVRKVDVARGRIDLEALDLDVDEDAPKRLPVRQRPKPAAGSRAADAPGRRGARRAAPELPKDPRNRPERPSAEPARPARAAKARKAAERPQRPEGLVVRRARGAKPNYDPDAPRETTEVRRDPRDKPDYEPPSPRLRKGRKMKAKAKADEQRKAKKEARKLAERGKTAKSKPKPPGKGSKHPKPAGPAKAKKAPSDRKPKKKAAKPGSSGPSGGRPGLKKGSKPGTKPGGKKRGR